MFVDLVTGPPLGGHIDDAVSVDVDTIRRTPGYDTCFGTFVDELVAASDHVGFAAIVDHFIEWGVDVPERES